MALLKSLALAASLLLAAPAITIAQPAKANRELELARDYVFAACLIERYPGEPLRPKNHPRQIQLPIGGQQIVIHPRYSPYFHSPIKNV